MSLRSHQIPRYVDSMYQFFFWEFDEFIVVVLIVGASFAFNHPIIGMVCAWYASSRLSKSKGNYLDGRLAHLAFHHGFLNLNKKFVHGGAKRVYYK